VLALLAAGFSRPFFRAALPPSGETVSGKRVLALIDRSASMQRERLWEGALERVEVLLRELKPQDAAAVYLFDSGLVQVMGWDEWQGVAPSHRFPTVVGKLEGYSAGWLAAAPGEALIKAAELLIEFSTDQEGEWSEHQPMEIWLFSDLAEGGRLDGFQGYEWPSGLTVRIEPVVPKNPGNAGIHLVQPRSMFAAAQPRVRVVNSRDASQERFLLRFERVGSGNQQGPPVEVYLPSGQSRAFDFPFSLKAGETARVRLEGDPHEFDNTLHFHLPVAQPVRVVFAGVEKENDFTFFFLQAALKPAGEEFLSLKRQTPGPGMWEAFSEAGLIIVAASLDAPEAERLLGLAEEGRTVLMLLETGVENGERTHLPGFDPVELRKSDPNRYALIGEINFNHPLLLPFADPRFSDFTRIHFWRHRGLSEEALGGALVLARFDTGDPYLVHLPAGEGNVFIMTSGWDPSESQLALSSKFVPLLLSLIEQSGNMPSQKGFHLAGGSIDLPRELPRPVSVFDPEGGTVVIENQERLFFESDQPGIYRVAAGDEESRFAVNLSPSESQTAPVAVDQLEGLGLPLKGRLDHPAPTRQTEIKQAAIQLEQQQKIWKWMVVAALLFGLLETWLAGRRTGI
jgi:hypothetical protein